MAECGGGVVVEVTANRVVLEGGQLPYLQLDEHRLAFSKNHVILRQNLNKMFPMLKRAGTKMFTLDIQANVNVP